MTNPFSYTHWPVSWCLLLSIISFVLGAWIF